MILIHKNYGVLFGADPPALPSWLLSLSVLKSCDEAKAKEKCLHFLRFLVGNRPRSSGKAWLLRTLSSAKLTKISVFPNAMEGHFFVVLRFRSGAHHVLAIWDDVLDNATLYLKQQHTSMVISHMVWSMPSYPCTWISLNKSSCLLNKFLQNASSA